MRKALDRLPTNENLQVVAEELEIKRMEALLNLRKANFEYVKHGRSAQA